MVVLLLYTTQKVRAVVVRFIDIPFLANILLIVTNKNMLQTISLKY